MKSSASSPAGHIYSLSQLTGKRAKIIRDLNLLAPAKYFTDEIQMVSWSLQYGLSYEELGKLGQEMVDSVIPHYKVELRESILNQIEKNGMKSQIYPKERFHLAAKAYQVLKIILERLEKESRK